MHVFDRADELEALESYMAMSARIIGIVGPHAATLRPSSSASGASLR